MTSASDVPQISTDTLRCLARGADLVDVRRVPEPVRDVIEAAQRELFKREGGLSW